MFEYEGGWIISFTSFVEPSWLGLIEVELWMARMPPGFKWGDQTRYADKAPSTE
jgi:hypothetical protein